MHSAYVTMKKPYWRFPDEHANFYIEPGSPPDLMEENANEVLYPCCYRRNESRTERR
jgi:hypothetical protein